MTTGTGATTDPDAGRRTPRYSVRLRIGTAIAVLAAVAMVVSGVLVFALEMAQIEAEVTDQVDQEIAEFRALEAGDDPSTGAPFTQVDRLLGLFLDRNVPDDDEMLVARVDGANVGATPNAFVEGVLDEPDYDRAVTGVEDTGGTVVFDSDEYGEVWISAVPVRSLNQPDTSGALVVINFLADERGELARTMRTYALVTVFSLVALTLIALWQAGRLLAPLRTLRATADDITSQDLSGRIPVQGNDDITALTLTFNTMLDRLESGFEDQRRFLDDAGHELRTPLTIIRGHLEVLDATDAADFTETQGLLLDEVDRMSRLVGDLILLAKSRRPDFLHPAPINVEQVVGSAMNKAIALGERDWQAELDTPEPRPVVLADEQRITQALLQLADNAVKHTGAGDRIEFGTTYRAGEVGLWVRDSGDGVPADDRSRVFERFGRSGVRPHDEGFGLGLSIVSAIVDAHGGRATISDAPGRGTHVEIILPTTEESTWPGS